MPKIYKLSAEKKQNMIYAWGMKTTIVLLMCLLLTACSEKEKEEFNFGPGPNDGEIEKLEGK